MTKKNFVKMLNFINSPNKANKAAIKQFRNTFRNTLQLQGQGLKNEMPQDVS